MNKFVSQKIKRRRREDNRCYNKHLNNKIYKKKYKIAQFLIETIIMEPLRIWEVKGIISSTESHPPNSFDHTLTWSHPTWYSTTLNQPHPPIIPPL